MPPPLPTTRLSTGRLNADLHSHSTVSDGTLTPSDLACRAHANGVDLWALTDHDELGGLQDAASAAARLGLGFMPGVEISVTFAAETVHILGLGIDPQDAQLITGLANVRGGRRERARQMAAGLERAGIGETFEGALRHAGNPDLISRTHFARHLVERGVCSSTNEVFRRYLVEGKPGFVPHQWARLAEAVRWIAQAGGVAVIAHPARYKFTANEEYALFSEFVEHGGQAVEVVSGSHGASDMSQYADMAREFELAASRGSDFHDPRESRLDIGAAPPLPIDLRPVWDLLSWADAASAPPARVASR